MDSIELGVGKSAFPAFHLNQVSIVPSRRTRNYEDVSVAWEMDAMNFDIPVIASSSDGIVSPDFAIEISRLGGAGVLNLEGLWTRFEDPTSIYEELATLNDNDAIEKMRKLYLEPIKDELITERISTIHKAGAHAMASLSPQNVEKYAPLLAKLPLDTFVIRSTVVSAEHVSKSEKPLDLKKFIREYEIPTIVGGCASYHAALHLMRSGAVGVLVGIGTGRSRNTHDVLGISVPQATAIADAKGARMRHLDETGVYVHVIADGAMSTGADMAKAIVCGADGLMLGAPLAAAQESCGKGDHWGTASEHSSLPRGKRVKGEIQGSLHDILFGPAKDSSGTMNLIGALRHSMATCGYDSLKDFQMARLCVNRQGY